MLGDGVGWGVLGKKPDLHVLKKKQWKTHVYLVWEVTDNDNCAPKKLWTLAGAPTSGLLHSYQITLCTVIRLFWTVFVLNDLVFYRTAIVVYQLFYRMVLGSTFDAGSIIKFLSQVSLGAYVNTLQVQTRWYKTMLLMLIGFIFDQCCSGPCIWNCISTMAGLYFQWHNHRDFTYPRSQLYCFLHCKIIR